jgi:hypothetical protein
VTVDLKKFWRGSPKNPRLTDKLVKAAQKELQVTLPASYLRLLKIPHSMTDHGHNIMRSPALIDIWDLPERQVILAGEGHYWITLDYRGGEVPSVRWLHLEREQNFEVAPTFDQFLDGLVPEDP